MNTKEKDVSFPGSKTDVSAFLAVPTDVTHLPFPAVIVVHEIFGLTDHIKDVTRRFAQEGYVGLAVDLFSNKSKALCMFRFMAALLQGSTTHFGIRDLQASLDFLSQQSFVDKQRIGAIGFCSGGGFAIALAMEDQRLQAIAPFYATNPKPLSRLAGLCPVVGSYPEKDFTAKSGIALEDSLKKYDVANDIRVYPEAKHGFMDPHRKSVYNEVAAEDAWSRTLAFFNQYIKKA